MWDGVVDKPKESATGHFGMTSGVGGSWGRRKEHQRGEGGIWRSRCGDDDVDDVGTGEGRWRGKEEGWPCWLVVAGSGI